jgi:hypothetical protein
LQAAMALLQHLKPLVAADQQAAYAARWQAAFGERARRLGWQPQPGDSDDDRLLRTALLPAVAVLGDDAGLRQQALQLAQAWLADRTSLRAELRLPVLTAATRADGPDSGPVLFHQLLAALQASTVRTERGDLLAALGQFRLPGLPQQARAVLLQPQIDLRDSLWPLLPMVAKACSVIGRPGRRPSWRPCRRPAVRAAWCQAGKGSAARASAARPAQRAFARTAACGSSASAACGSKASTSTGGAPSSAPGSTSRPGSTPGTKPRRCAPAARSPPTRPRRWRAASPSAPRPAAPAKASSSRARATTSSMSGSVGHGAHGIGKGLHLLHELGVLDLVERPLRLASCTPACSSL